MTDRYAHVSGFRLTSVLLTIPNQGPWWADLDFEDAAPSVTGRVTLTIGSTTFSGTVDSHVDGTHGLQRKCRIVAGAGGWGRLLAAKNYHNDAGVKAINVAEDAARQAGESIGGFVPSQERVGNDYVRESGPASRVLTDVIGTASWWVDFAGVTHVGTRTEVPTTQGSYEVLEFDPRDNTASIAIDGGDLTAVGIGSVLSERLDTPQVVRELEIRITGEDQAITVWCGGGESSRGRFASLFASAVARLTDGELFGKYRYRVVRMASTRVELQAVSARNGLPDVLPVSVWPGVAGVHAVLSPGAEVLVEFIAGDRAQPIVTHFAGPDGAGFVPVSLTLGGTAGSPAARSGDSVEILFPPAIFSGTIGGSPASGVLTFPAMKAVGVITAGSSKVSVAS